MRCQSFRLLCVFLTLSLPSYAEFPIDSSISPNGKLQLAVEPGPEDQGDAEGTIRIERTDSNTVLGTFPFSGFGESPGTDCLYSIHWNKSARAFAYCWEITRGYSECGICVNRKDRWQQVTLPNFVREVLKQENLKSGDGKGYEKPVEWVSENTLKVQVYQRVLLRVYDVYLKMVPDLNAVKIEKIVRRAEDQ